MSEFAVRRARAVGFDPFTLGLTIFPTERCNFRCVYCYEIFPNLQLDDAVTSSILQLLEKRSHDLRVLSIGWFGGEPLLASERVLEIGSFARNLSLKRGFEFHSHMTTNASLLDLCLFERLLCSGITNFQISLDGTEEEHNKTRRGRKGEGTYSQIVENLLRMRQSRRPFEVTLRLHVHDHNVQSILELIDRVGEWFKGDKRFKVNIQRIMNYGGVRKNPLKLATAETEVNLHALLANSLPASQILETGSTLQCCYASLPNHFVIRANGKVQKCTVALYDERNNVGELAADGSISWTDQQRLTSWSAGLFEGDLEKMLCPWKVMQREGKTSKSDSTDVR